MSDRQVAEFYTCDTQHAPGDKHWHPSVGWSREPIPAFDKDTESEAISKPIPDTPSLRETAQHLQDNAVVPNEYEDYYLVRRDDYAALAAALRGEDPR